MGKLEKELDTWHTEQVIELRLPNHRLRATMLPPFWIGRRADAFDQGCCPA
jgi:hypothetical protein